MEDKIDFCIWTRAGLFGGCIILSSILTELGFGAGFLGGCLHLFFLVEEQVCLVDA